MIIIQKIETFWTKKSRGFPNSQRRSKVPELIYKDLGTSYTNEAIVLQSFIHEEYNEFKPNYKEKWLKKTQIRQEQLELEVTENKLSIHYWGINSKYGNAKFIGKLELNNWLQFIINERFPLEHTSGYKKWVYNMVYINKQENLINTLRKSPQKSQNLQTKRL